MIKAELHYNPYLLETIVKFNEQKPKINSLIEKYSDKKLQDWINILPKIFYDEMNGYDFDFDFFGLESDYKRIVKSFRDNNVSEGEVRVFLKNTLETPTTKIKSIKKLLGWLKETANQRYGFDDANNERFNDVFPFIVIGKSDDASINISGSIFQIESIEDYNELTNTDLTNTPILFIIDKTNDSVFRNNLVNIINHSEVSKSQLFFYVSPTLDLEIISRRLMDLGIENPRFVSSVSDEAIVDYCEVYPMTQFIYDFIKVMDMRSNDINDSIKNEIEKSKIVNSKTHSQINEIEGSIKRLQKSLTKLEQRDNVRISHEYSDIREEFKEAVYSWNRKKTKITNDTDAKNLSSLFNDYLKGLFEDFKNGIESTTQNTLVEIKDKYHSYYVEANEKDGFNVKYDYEKRIAAQTPSIIGKLLDTKEQKHVPKKGFLGIEGKKSPETVLEVTYYYKKWRDLAWEQTYLPIINDIIDEEFQKTNKAADDIAQKYINHIKELIKVKTKEKEKTISKLSNDERILQSDNDWVECFIRKLNDIKEN